MASSIHALEGGLYLIWLVFSFFSGVEVALSSSSFCGGEVSAAWTELKGESWMEVDW